MGLRRVRSSGARPTNLAFAGMVGLAPLDRTLRVKILTARIEDMICKSGKMWHNWEIGVSESATVSRRGQEMTDQKHEMDESRPFVSEARLRANRENAAKSTGPRTDEGKDISRRNAQTHGLTGAVLVPPGQEMEAVADRVRDWSASLKPADEFEAWLVEFAVVASVRMDRGNFLHDARCEMQAERAAACWDEDRRLLAEEIGDRLGTRPAQVVRKLRKTVQGCDWLISHWRALENVLNVLGAWEEAHRARAAGLLGIAPEYRESDPRIRADAPVESLREVIRGEVEELEGLKADGLQRIDIGQRNRAMDGLILDDSPESRLVRRYEAENKRAFYWALGRLAALKIKAAQAPPPPPPSPPAPAPAPTRPPAARPEPIFTPTASARSLNVGLIDEVPTFGPGPAPSRPFPENRRMRKAREAMERRRR